MSDAARSSGGNLKDCYDGAPKRGIWLPLYVENELKEPSKNLAEHCTSLQCSSDLLIGLREIGAEWCRSELIDFQLLVKNIQIGGCGE